MEWYLIALVSAFFSALAAIFEKKVLFKEKALAFSFILALFNFVLAVPFFFFMDFSVLTASGLGVLFFKSILGAGAFLCVMLGIKKLELSSALPLLVWTPALAAFFAFVFLGESLTLFSICGMGLLLVGTYVLQLKGRQGIFEPYVTLFRSRGYMYILFALALFTTTSILDKALLKNFKVPINAFMGFQHMFLALVFLIFVFASSGSGGVRDLKSVSKKSLYWIFGVAVFTIIYRYTQLSAVKVAPVALVLSLKRVSVFFAAIIGGRIFRESDLLRKGIATGIMVAGVVLVIVF